MKKKILMPAFLLIIFLVQGLYARAQEARRRFEMMNEIRKEKFDIILPRVMRENKIDMWITMMKEGHPDPINEDLGGGMVQYYGFYKIPYIGYYIFTDRGGDRIERAALEISGPGLSQPGLYDIFGPASDLKKFVTERNPKRIAVNMSDEIGAADGLSHKAYLHLVETLGEPYTSRLVSSEKLISEFRSRRVPSEIVAFAEAASITVEIAERALSNEVITPGKTTQMDVTWWIADQFLTRGLEPSMPYVIRLPLGAGTGNVNYADSIIQRGDMLSLDIGAGLMNFRPDLKRIAYVLREGEAAPPSWMQKAFEKAQKVQEIICKNIKAGRTGTETLEIIKRKVLEAGFDLTTEVLDQTSDNQRDEVFLDPHSTGNLAHCVGPSIAFWQPLRLTFTIQPSNFLSIEFFLYAPSPELGKKKARIAIENDVIVTENGVQWLYPDNNRILIIK